MEDSSGCGRGGAREDLRGGGLLVLLLRVLGLGHLGVSLLFLGFGGGLLRISLSLLGLALALLACRA